MEPNNSQHIKEFEGALEGWTDQRFVTRDQIRDLAKYLLYLVNLAEADGWEYDGHSWKESEYLGCLVVKATVDGIPSVVFTNAPTLAGGIRIFLRKMEAGVLEWQKDRFRT